MILKTRFGNLKTTKINMKKKPEKTTPEDGPEATEAASALFRSLAWVLPIGSIAAACVVGAFYGVGTAVLTPLTRTRRFSGSIVEPNGPRRRV